jgi:hypothetical protein
VRGGAARAAGGAGRGRGAGGREAGRAAGRRARWREAGDAGRGAGSFDGRATGDGGKEMRRRVWCIAPTRAKLVGMEGQLSCRS